MRRKREPRPPESPYARLLRVAKKKGIAVAAVPSTPPREIDLPSFGGCATGPGCRCAHGWHWRPVNADGSAFVYSDNDPTTGALDPVSYEGRQVAYERCPAYCEKAGWVIDPKDRQRLWVSQDRGKSARREIAE